MRRRLFIFQFPLLLLHSSAPAGADALWDRAIGVATANRDLVPGKWVERRESFDVKGEPHLTSSTTVGFTQSVTGDIHINLLAAESNGTDITEDMRSKFDEQIAHFTLQNPEYNPFHPSHQGQIKAEQDGRSRVVGAQVLVAYTYRQTTDEGQWRGTTWIDEVTGRPSELSVRLRGLPKMIGEDERHELILNVTFYSGPEPMWYPSRIVTLERATLNTFPHTAFYTTIETSIRLTEYWKIEFH
tara:strand:- start:1906 stop:2634 length:729 start_codon:yes stop_codon:yes gene_type:complete